MTSRGDQHTPTGLEGLPEAGRVETAVRRLLDRAAERRRGWSVPSGARVASRTAPLTVVATSRSVDIGVTVPAGLVNLLLVW